MRAALCFLYKKARQDEKAVTLAGTLPHERECREYVSPIVSAETDEEVIDKNIRYIILGEI